MWKINTLEKIYYLDFGSDPNPLNTSNMVIKKAQPRLAYITCTGAFRYVVSEKLIY